MKSHNTPEKNYDLERLVFFSDGVFAIAITLLVIEMRPPEHWDGTWTGLLTHILGTLIFYVISFFSLGLFWMAHRFIFRYVQSFNETAAFLNLLFLCLIGLMPFVNAMASEHGMPPVVLHMYLGEMAAVSATSGLMWFYVAFIAKLTDPRLTRGFKWYATARLTLTPLLIAGSSLWLGMKFGILPSIGFLIVAFYVANRLQLRPFQADPSAQKRAP